MLKPPNTPESPAFVPKSPPLFVWKELLLLKREFVLLIGAPKIYVKTSFGHMINISGLLFVFLFFLILF